ncbi:hypothetical protein FACS189449_10780 [Alphaproteobacteria bacterium]|nr:hypothetical protein FACS189449_10780 [Alphaproteobacteria bacterium]
MFASGRGNRGDRDNGRNRNDGGIDEDEKEEVDRTVDRVLGLDASKNSLHDQIEMKKEVKELRDEVKALKAKLQDNGGGVSKTSKKKSSKNNSSKNSSKNIVEGDDNTDEDTGDTDDDEDDEDDESEENPDDDDDSTAKKQKRKIKQKRRHRKTKVKYKYHLPKAKSWKHVHPVDMKNSKKYKYGNISDGVYTVKTEGKGIQVVPGIRKVPVARPKASAYPNSRYRYKSYATCNGENSYGPITYKIKTYADYPETEKTNGNESTSENGQDKPADVSEKSESENTAKKYTVKTKYFKNKDGCKNKKGC